MHPEAKEIIAKSMYFHWLCELGFPNGQPTWEEMETIDVPDMDRRRYFLAAADFAITSGYFQPSMPDAAAPVRVWPIEKVAQ